MCQAWPKAISQPGPAFPKLGLVGPSLRLRKAQSSGSWSWKPWAVAWATALLVSFCLIVRAGHYLRNFDWLRTTLHISISFLQDLLMQVQSLQDFIAFSSSHATALHYLRSVVTPLVPAILDAVYKKLLSFGITAKSFMPRQTGYTGIAPESIEELTNHWIP